MACQLSIGISASTTPARRRRYRALRACAFTWRTATDLLLRCRRHPAHANTGHGEKLPNGWWNAFQKSNHGFSFPLRYFDEHHLPHDWPAFLGDFQRHWPTDDQYAYVDFVRNGLRGNGAARCGNTRWRRITEERARAKSVFHFDVPGSVAKSTHAGLPWLRYIRLHVPGAHHWPFDAWNVPAGRSVVAEVIHLSGAAASRERIGTNISMTPFPWRNGCAAQT